MLILCAGCCVLIQRLKAKCKTRKMTHICHRHREHEERKAVSVLLRSFIAHMNKDSVGESSGRVFFQHTLIRVQLQAWEEA